MSYLLIYEPESGKWEKTPEGEFTQETEMQELVKDNPDIIPLSDLGDDIPPMLVVGRESSLPNGNPDLICVDENGLITVIECKLAKNPEVKRKVVGQILGYGAYLWQSSYEDFDESIARAYFNNDRCHDPSLRGKTLVEAMAAFREFHEVEAQEGAELEIAQWTEEDFRSNVATNLARGRIRLLVVVDKINPELRRIVEFVNECTGSNFEMLCAELKYFEKDKHRIIMPHLIGLAKREARAPSSRLNEAKFIARVEKERPEAFPLVEELLRFAKAISDNRDSPDFWAKSSFTPAIFALGKRLPLFTVYTRGKIALEYSRWKGYLGDVAQRHFAELSERLNKISLVDFSTNDLETRYLTFDLLEDFREPKDIAIFKDAMHWIVDQMRAESEE